MNKAIITLQAVILAVLAVIAIECGAMLHNSTTQPEVVTADPQVQTTNAETSFFIDGETVYFDASNAQPGASYFINGDEVYFN